MLVSPAAYALKVMGQLFGVPFIYLFALNKWETIF